MLELDLNVKINYGVVLRGGLGDVDKIVQIINDNLGDARVVYSTTSASRLYIQEERE